MNDNEDAWISGGLVFHLCTHTHTHTHGAKVRLFTPLCDVSRAAGGRTDGAWHHSSHQDMEPISPTQRGGWLLCIMHTHNLVDITLS